MLLHLFVCCLYYSATHILAKAKRLYIPLALGALPIPRRRATDPQLATIANATISSSEDRLMQRHIREFLYGIEFSTTAARFRLIHCIYLSLVKHILIFFYHVFSFNTHSHRIWTWNLICLLNRILNPATTYIVSLSIMLVVAYLTWIFFIYFLILDRFLGCRLRFLITGSIFPLCTI